MAIIWQTVDRLGRQVALTDDGWAHIADRREDLLGLQDRIRIAVELADEVWRDARYPHRDVHYLTSRADWRPLRVVVNYRPQAPSAWAGEIVTAMQTSRRKRGEQRKWP